jgi:gas vesicle protein
MDIPQGFDRLLAELGLQKQRSAARDLLPAIGAFVAGAIVGGALALLLAPKSGRELRSEINKRIRRTADHEPSAAGDNGDRAVIDR